MVSKEDSNGVSHNYTYDLAGNRIAYQLKQNGQNIINLTYTYDKQNHPLKVNEGGAQRASYSYDTNGNCIETQYDNGIKTSFDYNKANMITNMSNKFNNNNLSSYAYTYYLDGNQRTKTDHLNKMTTYEYDGLGRLKKETDQDAETVYTYDLSSNRTKMNVNGATPFEIDYSYDANDRLVWEETQKAGNVLATTEYFYDDNGNQISKLFNDLTDQNGAEAGVSLDIQPGTPYYEQYEYDGFNRLTSYLTPTCTAEYTYDAEGLRISKNVNGQLTRHIWDGNKMVMEEDENSQVIDRYIRGTRVIKSDLNGYYLHNAHGDVIQLANQQGIVTKDYLYDAFGNENEAQANDTNPFRYCGEYLDKESGNVYLRARYYDPTNGRFISKDSNQGKITNPLTLNLYTYCNNNPINFVDPTGHDSVTIGGTTYTYDEPSYTIGGVTYGNDGMDAIDEAADESGLDTDTSSEDVRIDEVIVEPIQEPSEQLAPGYWGLGANAQVVYGTGYVQISGFDATNGEQIDRCVSVTVGKGAGASGAVSLSGIYSNNGTLNDIKGTSYTGGMSGREGVSVGLDINSTNSGVITYIPNIGTGVGVPVEAHAGVTVTICLYSIHNPFH